METLDEIKKTIKEKEELKKLVLNILKYEDNIIDFVLLVQIRKVKNITMLELVVAIEEMKKQGLLFQPRIEIIAILN